MVESSPIAIMESKYHATMKFIKELDCKNPKFKNILDDLFWPIDKWPKHLVINLHTCEYRDRISIVSFLQKNGFPPYYAFDMIKFYAKPSRFGTAWNIREIELKSVWRKCEQVTSNGTAVDREKYFYYCMINKAVYNYAGQRKLYGRVVSDAPVTAVTRPDEVLDLKKKMDGDDDELLECVLFVEKEYEQKVLNEILEEARNLN